MTDQTKNQGRGEQLRSLRTYLRDHTAGAEQAIHLFKALANCHAGKPLGRFAETQRIEIEEDLKALEDLAKCAGADDFEVKELAGWLGDKLTRLKLSPLGDPFSTFEALEFLSLGILGKRALWRTLISIASLYPELNGTDLVVLLERAEAQYSATEEMRLQQATRTFT